MRSLQYEEYICKCYVRSRTYLHIFDATRVYFVRIDRRDRNCRYKNRMYIFSTGRSALFDGVCMSKLEIVNFVNFFVAAAALIANAYRQLLTKVDGKAQVVTL